MYRAIIIIHGRRQLTAIKADLDCVQLLNFLSFCTMAVSSWCWRCMPEWKQSEPPQRKAEPPRRTDQKTTTFPGKAPVSKEEPPPETELLLWHGALQRTSMFWKRALHQKHWGQSSNSLATESACFARCQLFRWHSYFSTFNVSTTWIARAAKTQMDPATVAPPNASERREWKLLQSWAQKRARITLEVRFSM